MSCNNSILSSVTLLNSRRVFPCDSNVVNRGKSEHDAFVTCVLFINNSPPETVPSRASDPQ